jgi:hypothetical protein
MVEITNLSLEGARLRTPAPLTAGSHVWLKMPMLASRKALVVWANGLHAGCEFTEPLDAMIMEVLTRARSTQI